MVRGWVVVIAAWAAAAGACGSKSSPSVPASSSTTSTVTTPSGDPDPGPVPDSRLNTILGRPTDTSIAVSVAADAGTELSVEFGLASLAYSGQTGVQVAASQPVVFDLTGLRPDTRYYYRVRYRLAGDVSVAADTEHSFHTKRAAGGAFTFGVQGDSHPERVGKMFDADLYVLNARNVAARRPDFYICLGDDFSVENLVSKGQVTQADVDAVYQRQRPYLGILGSATPVFLVNGNHEEADAYLLGSRYPTPFHDVPVFAGRSRLAWFALPAPGTFFSGDTTEVAGVGLPRDYYAWEWGDALFVVIDPYWHSPVPVDAPVPGVDRPANQWDITMGDEQYQWLKRTLESSRAAYKFVFEHHVLGTGRGAAALVHQFEWGGYNQRGTAFEFPSFRPGWARPIHQLMNDNGVTIFFAGHDHLFAREKVDGVVYQSVPNPADNTYTAFNADAYVPSAISLPGAAYDPSYGAKLPNAGFLLVSVSPAGVTVAYVKAVLPGDESKAGASNGTTVFTYTLPAKQ